MSERSIPLARRSSLSVVEVDGELVVTDEVTQQRFPVRADWVAVWRLCDGSRDIRAVAESAGPGVDVWAALDALADLGLLESRVVPPTGGRLTRRGLLRASVVGGAVLGVVGLHPTAAAAAGEQQMKEQLAKPGHGEAAAKERKAKRPTGEQSKKEQSSKEQSSKEQQSKASATPTPLALQGDWTNYGSDFAPATVQRDRFGRVLLAGVVRSATFPTLVAVLPASCRPTERIVAAGNVHQSSARIDILPDGSVLHVAGRTTDWVSLSGISFLTGAAQPIALDPAWTPYGEGYAAPASALGGAATTAQGLARGDTGLVGNLPAGQELPVGRLVCSVLKGGDACRVDVLPDGRVYHVAGGGTSWLSLAGVSFHHDQRALPLVNGWVPYGSGYAPPAVSRDADGVVRVNGLIRGGSWGQLGQLDVGDRPSRRHVFSVSNHANVARVDVLPDGGIWWVGGSSDHGWVSLTGLCFPTA